MACINARASDIASIDGKIDQQARPLHAFDAFYDARKEALARLIELKTGLKVVRSEPGAAVQDAEEIDSVVDDLEVSAVAAE